MMFSSIRGSLGNWRSRRKNKSRGHRGICANSLRSRQLSSEPLESRLLLSAEYLPGLVEYLPGLVGRDELAAQTAGQVIHLDFDGQQDVTYDGPVRVEGIDVPAFSNPALADPITEYVGRLLAPLGVAVTADLPKGEFSTIYIGGGDDAFAAYGVFNGLAEGVDVGNAHRDDIAFVFSDNLASGLDVAMVAAHEAGHLLGLAHSDAAAGGEGVLAEVAHEQGVHAFITDEAAKFYDQYYAGSELVSPAVSPSYPDGPDGYVNWIALGAWAQDEEDWQPDGYTPTLTVTERHFVEGGDGNELYDGLHAYTSAYELAVKFLNSYALPTYNAGDKNNGYGLLGHVAHLLQDMTVPAHVHNDIHPSCDAYEKELTRGVYIWYEHFGVDKAMGPIRSYEDFDSLFRETTDYTDDYDSDDYKGDANLGHEPNNLDFPQARLNDLGLTSRHRPGAEVNNDNNENYGCGGNWAALPPSALLVLADDLMPWAIEQTAALYRFFYKTTDTSAPLVGQVDLPVTSLTGFKGVPRYDSDPGLSVTGAAQDAESGVDRGGYEYHVQRYDFPTDDWGPWLLAAKGSETETIVLPDGYYRIVLRTTNGADKQNVLDDAPTVTFQVGASPAGDANGDGQFDQFDIVEVLQSAKYLTGEYATWREGDWTGDGVFDQLDIVAAQQTGSYMQSV